MLTWCKCQGWRRKTQFSCLHSLSSLFSKSAPKKRSFILALVHLINKEIHFQLTLRLLLAVLHGLSVLDFNVCSTAWVEIVKDVAEGGERFVLWQSFRFETLHPSLSLGWVVTSQTLQLLQPQVFDGHLQHHLLVLLCLRDDTDLKLVVDAGNKVPGDLHVKLHHVSTFSLGSILRIL